MNLAIYHALNPRHTAVDGSHTQVGKLLEDVRKVLPIYSKRGHLFFCHPSEGWDPPIHLHNVLGTAQTSPWIPAFAGMTVG